MKPSKVLPAALVTSAKAMMAATPGGRLTDGSIFFDLPYYGKLLIWFTLIMGH
jgi:hypothetical protein